MNDDDEEKIAEVVSTIAVALICIIAVLLLLSASVWVYDTWM